MCLEGTVWLVAQSNVDNVGESGSQQTHHQRVPSLHRYASTQCWWWRWAHISLSFISLPLSLSSPLLIMQDHTNSKHWRRSFAPSFSTETATPTKPFIRTLRAPPTRTWCKRCGRRSRTRWCKISWIDASCCDVYCCDVYCCDVYCAATTRPSSTCSARCSCALNCLANISKYGTVTMLRAVLSTPRCL